MNGEVNCIINRPLKLYPVGLIGSADGLLRSPVGSPVARSLIPEAGCIGIHEEHVVRSAGRVPDDVKRAVVVSVAVGRRAIMS